MQAFFEYIRGNTDVIPAGYNKKGLDLYRRLVFIGVEQTLSLYYPKLKEGVSNDEWITTVEEFIKESRFESNFLASLADEFRLWLSTKTVSS
jgi:hypothetical protein